MVSVRWSFLRRAQLSSVVLRRDGAWFGEPLGDINSGVEEDITPGIEGAGSDDEFRLAAEV